MRIIFFVSLIGWVSFSSLKAQLSLEMCIDSAIANHPRSQNMALIKRITENKLENYTSSWYPDFTVKGQATYQSDVIEFDLETPMQGLEFPSVPKDQYKLYLDIRQTLYDGGQTKKKKALEELSSGIKITETENEIENIRSDIIELYYNILKLQEQTEIMNITRHQLQEHEKVVRASVANGIALKSDIDLVVVEFLDITQEIDNTRKKINSLLKLLSSLTGMDISRDIRLENTEFGQREMEVKRKELKLVEQHMEVTRKSAELLNVSRRPVAFAFGQAGYGKPGLNMLNDEFDSYYLVGFGLQWQIWDWSKTKREKGNLNNEVDLLRNEKKALEENIERARISQKTEIEEHRRNINNYTKILELRKKISETYRDQLDNGTIKTIDYLKVLNQEKIMKIRLKTEKILHQQAIAKYRLISGDLIFE
ncbi:MAG: TolC family protein [Bacteroidota bacterium]